jgi:hypothetical protein
MVQTSKPEHRLPPAAADTVSLSALLDPALLQAARMIYRTFYEVHPDEIQRPVGVALDRFSLRGKLIFGAKPILLPRECFVPLSQIEPSVR